MKSESIKELAKALCLAQSETASASLDSINPFLKNRYASLGSVIEALRPVLKRHGLSYSQLVTGSGDEIGVVTIVMHESGEWLESCVSLPLTEEKGKSRAQVAGSIVSYLRRYGLAAAFGVYAEEDTDGADKHGREKSPAGNKTDTNTLVANLVKAADGKVTVDEAMTVLSPGGTMLSQLTDDQLIMLVKATDKRVTLGMKIAAALVVTERQNERVRDDDVQEYSIEDLAY